MKKKHKMKDNAVEEVKTEEEPRSDAKTENIPEEIRLKPEDCKLSDDTKEKRTLSIGVMEIKVLLEETIMLSEKLAKHPGFNGVDPYGNEGMSLVLSRIHSAITRLKIARDHLKV